MSGFFKVLIFIVLLSGCSHLKSGHYVQMKEGESLKSLARDLKVPLWKIKAVNKKDQFRPHEWVFIPLERGILNRNTYSFDAEEFIKSHNFLWPVPSSKKISSLYGHRKGRKHDGIDIPARSGASILAVAKGIVVYSGKGLKGYGNLTVLAHDEGIFSVYAHAKRNYTRKGQKVYRGQVIAVVGSTGRSTGPHLHFEIRQNGRPLNPQKFLALNH